MLPAKNVNATTTTDENMGITAVEVVLVYRKENWRREP